MIRSASGTWGSCVQTANSYMLFFSVQASAPVDVGGDPRNDAACLLSVDVKQRHEQRLPAASHGCGSLRTNQSADLSVCSSGCAIRFHLVCTCLISEYALFYAPLGCADFLHTPP